MGTKKIDHFSGGPRQKRGSTLPGEGDTRAEKVRRIAALRSLHGVLEKEKADWNAGQSAGTPRIFIFGRNRLPSVRDLLDGMSTQTLVGLAAAYTGNVSITLTNLLDRVVLSGEWNLVVGNDKQLLEQMLFDVLSFHQHLKDSVYSAQCGSSAFRQMYEVTGHRYGTLSSLMGRERDLVEALLFVGSSSVSENFNPLLYGRHGSPFMGKRLTEDIIARVSETPDLARPIVQYCDERGIALNDLSDSDWDGLSEYLMVGSSLREGSL